MQTDGIKLLGGFFDFIGGFVNLVGPSAFYLMIITVFVLWVVNIVSPLAKVINYIVVVVLLGVLALSTGVGVLPSVNYVVVMAIPLAIAQGVGFLWYLVRTRILHLRRSDRISRAAHLSAQLNAQIKALR